MATLKKRIAAWVRRHRLPVVLATLSAIFYFVGFCGFDQFYLAWFCFVPLLWAIDDPRVKSREAFAYGWLFGTMTILGGYTWLTTMIETFGGFSFLSATGILVLFSAAHGLLWAIWITFVHYLSVVRNISMLWTVPMILVVCEWLFPSLFPTYLANTQYRQLLLIQSADLFGPFGLTFILALASATIYRVVSLVRRRPQTFPTVGIAATLSAVAGSLAYGWIALADHDDTAELAERRIRIGVVQTNMGIFEKHQRPEEGLRRHRQQSLEVEKQGAELIVWPESGYNRTIPTEMANVGAPVLGPVQTPLLFGGIRFSGLAGDHKLYNTAFLTDGAGNVLGTYDKTYLLAFGEYMPFGSVFPGLYRLSPNTSRFEFGEHQHALRLNDIRLGVLICYEDVLTHFVRSAMHSKPNILVNITNDAWFGATREPHIHLALSVFRAIEQRRYLVRATNTGVSAVIDSGGRILDPTPTFARANIVRDVPALESVTVYQRFGPWLPLLCLLTSLFWLRHVVPPITRRVCRGFGRITRHRPQP